MTISLVSPILVGRAREAGARVLLGGCVELDGGGIPVALLGLAGALAAAAAAVLAAAALLLHRPPAAT